MRIRAAAAFVVLIGALPLPDQRATTATLAGTVIDGATGDPVADATVTVSGATEAGPNLKRDTAPTVTMKTDAAGQFRIVGIQAGAYRVYAEKQRYFRGEYGARVPLGLGVPLEVVVGTQPPSLTIRVWPGAKVSGKVEDDQGRPLKNVTVLAFRTICGETRSHMVGSTAETNAGGIFRVEDLPPGCYILAVRPGRGVDPNTNYLKTFFPDATSENQAVTINLSPGDERTDLVIRATAGKAFARVSGVVGRPDGSPLPARVYLIPHGADDAFGSLDLRYGDFSADGRFTFNEVPPGEYRIELVEYPQWPRSETRPDPRRVHDVAGGPNEFPGDLPIDPLPKGSTYWAVVPIAVADVNVEDVRVPAQQGFEVRGKIVFKGTHARPDERTLTTRCVNIRAASPGGQRRFPAGRIEPDGSFRTLGQPPGKYLLGMLQGFAGWSLESITLNGREIAGRPFELDQDIDGVIVTLSDRETNLSGVVRDREGKLSASSWVLLFPEDRDSWPDSSVSVVRTGIETRIRWVRPTAQGVYRFVALPGKYFVIASNELDLSSAFLHKAALAAARVTLDPGRQASQNLTAVQVR